jgi:hypothetical protein
MSASTTVSFASASSTAQRRLSPLRPPPRRGNGFLLHDLLTLCGGGFLLYGSGKQGLDLGQLYFFIFKNHFFVSVHLRNRHHKEASWVTVDISRYKK